MKQITDGCQEAALCGYKRKESIWRALQSDGCGTDQRGGGEAVGGSAEPDPSSGLRELEGRSMSAWGIGEQSFRQGEQATGETVQGLEARRWRGRQE